MDNHPGAVLTPTSPPNGAHLPSPLPPSPLLPPYSPKPAASAAPIVYSRDFAYANNKPVIVLPARMAATNIANASAKTFAEYVSSASLLPRVQVKDAKEHALVTRWSTGAKAC